MFFTVSLVALFVCYLYRPKLFAIALVFVLAVWFYGFFVPSAFSSKLPPYGFSFYCLQHPRDCKAGKISHIQYSENSMQTIRKINKNVNRSIKPVLENNDIWRLSPEYGDCEDYVLTKRNKLIRSGIDAGALRIAVTRTKNQIFHAVLIVRTSRGEFVLDNLNNDVLTLSASKYKIIKQSTINPMIWR